MPRKSTEKDKGRGKGGKRTREDRDKGGSLSKKSTPQPSTKSTQKLEEDVNDSAADSVANDVVNAGVLDDIVNDDVDVIGNVNDDDDDDDDDLEGSSPSKYKKARVQSNLTDKEQEKVALFLEKTEHIYNKTRTDYTCTVKRNKAWKRLATEMGKKVKALTTFYESIRTQLGKLKKRNGGEAPGEMSERQQWMWNRFQFLLPHIGLVSRRSVTSFTYSVNGEDTSRSPVTKIPPTITSTGTMLTVAKETEGSTDRQEKLLQVRQSPPERGAPYPERLKFAEYLGHAFQKLPKVIYRDLQKSMFDLLHNAEKEADLMVQPQLCGHCQPHPSTSQSPWQPHPSTSQSPWQQREMCTFTSRAPTAESHQPQRPSGVPQSQQDASFNLSEILMDMGPTAVASVVTVSTNQSN